MDAFGHLDPDSVDYPRVAGFYGWACNVANTFCLGATGRENMGPQGRVLRALGASVSPCVPTHSVGATCLGPVARAAWTPRKCVCNACNALYNRHAATRPPFTGDWSDVVRLMLSAAVVGAIEYSVVTGVCDYRAAWLAKWPATKRLLITQSLLYDRVLPWRVKAMIKREHYPKRPSKARAIQYHQNYATQAVYGPEYYYMQKAMTKLFHNYSLAPGIDVTIASGMSAADIGHWFTDKIRGGACCFVERDGANWDSTINEHHREALVDIYAKFCPSLARFNAQCENVLGVAKFKDGVLIYKLRGSVKSGHNDTTLGNGLLNAMIATHACVQLGVRASIIVAGDDLLIAAYNPVDWAAYAAVESSLGIRPEGCVFTDPAHVSFISGGFFRDGDAYLFGPKPGRLLAKLWWTVKPPPARRLAQYKRGVARGLLPSMGWYPGLGDWLRRSDTAGEAVQHDKSRLFSGGSWPTNPSDATAGFAERYGLSSYQLVEFTDFMRSLPDEPGLMVHPIVTYIVAVDLADPTERARILRAGVSGFSA